jgi:hypothetical protein
VGVEASAGQKLPAGQAAIVALEATDPATQKLPGVHGAHCPALANVPAEHTHEASEGAPDTDVDRFGQANSVPLTQKLPAGHDEHWPPM